MAILDIDQAKQLIANARFPRMKCTPHMALLGLSRGELLTLRWSQVDLESRTLC